MNKDAIKILDDAIAEINSMRNIPLCQSKDAISGGEIIKKIALDALAKTQASKSVMNNLRHISFGNEYSDSIIVKDGGWAALTNRVNENYQTGLQMVINLLQQERALRSEIMDNKRKDMSLRYSIIALAVSILSLLVTLFK